MTSTPGRRFDALPEPSKGSAALRFVLAHWGVTLALAWVVAVSLAAALGLLAADATTAKADAAAIRAITIAVVVDPQTPAADAKALGARLAALPGVAGAIFRTKDDGLKALAASGLPPPDGTNPLPDLWLLRLEPDPILSSARPVSAALASVRQGIAGLTPAVVRVDDALVASVDAAIARSRAAAPIVLWGGLAGLALLCGTVGYLAGSASVRRTSPGWSALAFMTLAAAAIASLLLGIVIAGLGAAVNGMPVASLKEGAEAAFTARRVACIGAPIVAWLMLLLGVLVGADRSALDS